MVSVRPARLPAKVTVAPNSPSARAQHRMAPAATDGATMGSVTRRNTIQRPAPRVAAASSRRRSDERSPASTVTTRKGRATNVLAAMTPQMVKGSWKPVWSNTGPPNRPRRPKANSSAAPPTTGGSTMGRITSARSSERPGNSVRASTQARGTPNSRDSPMALKALVRDRRSAWVTIGSRRRSDSDDHGTRWSRAMNGITRKATASAAKGRSPRGGRAPGRTLDRRRCFVIQA
jgi:hypothetical protein